MTGCADQAAAEIELYFYDELDPAHGPPSRATSARAPSAAWPSRSWRRSGQGSDPATRGRATRRRLDAVHGAAGGRMPSRSGWTRGDAWIGARRERRRAWTSRAHPQRASPRGRELPVLPGDGRTPHAGDCRRRVRGPVRAAPGSVAGHDRVAERDARTGCHRARGRALGRRRVCGAQRTAFRTLEARGAGPCQQGSASARGRPTGRTSAGSRPTC